jgi:hypothetical protein
VAGPGQYYAFDQATGAVNQFHRGNVSGGGGTTVAYDAALGQLYVLTAYSSGVGKALTAYSYVDNATITQLWQVTGPSVTTAASVAVGPGGLVYAASTSSITEFDPGDGSTVRSLGGLSLAIGVTPALSNGYLWAISNTRTVAYDLSTFTVAATLPGSRGSLNSAYDSPGALVDRYFLLDYGFYSQGFDVYANP